MKGAILEKNKIKTKKGKGFLDDLTKKSSSWEEVVKSYDCFFCQNEFTKKDIQEKNYQLTYASVYGVMEIYHVYHLQHREWYPNGTNCNSCQKIITNLVMVDEVKRTYHPNCFYQEKIIYHRKHVCSMINCGCC